MATGGLALLLSPRNQPHSFHGLETIGKVVYIFDLVIFTLVCLAITYRFCRWPRALRSSLTHPTESLFFGCFLLSIASIIAGMALYGIESSGYWLIVTYRVLFWIYFAVTFIAAVGLYCLLFTNPRLKIQDMTPAWDLPIFPYMLTGTVAAAGIAYQPRQYAVPMLFAGLTAQGLGMLVSICMYASYIRRMINYGFPSPQSRPGMFIAVGPPSFTSLAIIGLANHFPDGYAYFDGPQEITAQVVKIMALMTAVFIWSLSLWFWAISVVSCLAVYRQMKFHLNWWAFVFPNVGFTLATINIGKSLKSEGVMWVGSIMSILLVALYLFVLANHVKAVLKRDILSAGKDEDHYHQERRAKAEIRLENGEPPEKCTSSSSQPS
jgi:C4-dicarboxylate transporter/malic acid transport protein